MQTVMLPPISDAGPNEGSANPAGAHYLNLDEDPNDGDATHIQFQLAGLKEVLGLDVSGIPDGSTILALRVRWAAKAGASPAGGRAGLRIVGLYYFGNLRSLPAAYAAFDENMTHPDGQPWTKQRIGAVFLAFELSTLDDETVLPRPRLSQLVAFVDIIPLPERPKAIDAAIVGSAVASGIVSSGSGSAIVGSGSGVPVAPEAPSSINDRRTADPATTAPVGSVTPLDPNATVSET